jgi:hypothetical protein
MSPAGLHARKRLPPALRTIAQSMAPSCKAKPSLAPCSHLCVPASTCEHSMHMLQGVHRGRRRPVTTCYRLRTCLLSAEHTPNLLGRWTRTQLLSARPTRSSRCSGKATALPNLSTIHEARLACKHCSSLALAAMLHSAGHVAWTLAQAGTNDREHHTASLERSPHCDLSACTEVSLRSDSRQSSTAPKLLLDGTQASGQGS